MRWHITPTIGSRRGSSSTNSTTGNVITDWIGIYHHHVLNFFWGEGGGYFLPVTEDIKEKKSRRKSQNMSICARIFEIKIRSCRLPRTHQIDNTIPNKSFSRYPFYVTTLLEYIYTFHLSKFVCTRYMCVVVGSKF